MGRFEPYRAISSHPEKDTLEVEVKNGMKFLIDAEDADLVSQYIWHANGSGSRFYVNGRSLTERDENGGKKKIALHRLLTGAPKSVIVDHINGNTLDNRKANLRRCDFSQNMANARKRSDGTTSRFKGVSLQRRLAHTAKPWVAQICSTNLGYFEDEALAALAYDRTLLAKAGDFAATNFPKELIAYIDRLEADWAESQEKK